MQIFCHTALQSSYFHLCCVLHDSSCTASKRQEFLTEKALKLKDFEFNWFNQWEFKFLDPRLELKARQQLANPSTLITNCASEFLPEILHPFYTENSVRTKEANCLGLQELYLPLSDGSCWLTTRYWKLSTYMLCLAIPLSQHSAKSPTPFAYTIQITRGV